MYWIKDKKQPLLVICGPTASGKTAVGAAAAKELDGEVISADSMQLYKGMEIASAAPTEEEMLGVPHHLIGILDIDEKFSAADYARTARETVNETAARGKLPVIVGGTGLYIDSLINNINFEPSASDGSVRRELEKLAAINGKAYMMELLRKYDPQAAEKLHENNLVRVIRAIEMYRLTGRTFEENMKLSRERESPYEVCMIGLTFADRKDLYERIDTRVDIMIKNGMLDQAEELYRSGKMRTAAQAIGYKEFIPYFEGTASLDECIGKIKQVSRNYAKRQLTWFRHNTQIQWIIREKYEQNDKIIEKFLNIVAKSEIMCYNKK